MEERAYILSANVMESTGVDEFLRTEARRQLAEKEARHGVQHGIGDEDTTTLQ